MTIENDLQRRADDLLRLATATSNLGERSRLIGEAARLYSLASDPREEDPVGDGVDWLDDDAVNEIIGDASPTLAEPR